MTSRLVALLIAVLVLAGCSAALADETADGDGGELGATQWVLRSYLTAGTLTIVPDGLYADAEFKSGRVFGFGGCNEYDAVYRAGGRTLIISMPRTTFRACEEPVSAFDAAYLALLNQSRFYNVAPRSLTIRGSDGAVLLVFDAAPANPLLGAWLVDSYSNGTGGVRAPVPGSAPTAVFRLIQVSGDTGCNNFSGPYTTNGNVAAIGPLATTRLACPEDLTLQETQLLAAFQGVARVESRGAQLALQDRNGAIQVVLVRPSAPAASPSPSASASAAPSASASPSASPSPTATPSPSPTATPVPTPTATPAPTATPVASAAPTVAPPASLPPTATCQLLVTAGGATVPGATIVYPANWFTVTTPATIACRYFDQDPITVPADPATLSTDVMIQVDLTSTYQAALTAATNPTAWNVLVNEPATVSGLPATKIEATSTAGSDGVAVGTTRYGYLIDYGGRPAWIVTTGKVGNTGYATKMSAVDLIASQSTITVPPGL